MPLGARLDGEPIFAFELDDDDAQDLAARARRGEVSLTMACGRPGFLRRSKLGTRHFVHGRLKDVCDWPHASMTEEHMTAQRIIIDAARAAGWDAIDEVAGNGWRADVLATKGVARIAFEVQWSRQSDYRYWERQDAYQRDGVRAAWFVRSHGPYDADLFEPRKDLPLFRLSETQPFVAQVGGSTAVPLENAVAGLLGGRWQFRSQSPARRTTRVIAVLARCYHCSKWMTVHGVDSIETAPICPDSTRGKTWDDLFLHALPNEPEARIRDHPELAAAIQHAKLPPLAPIRTRRTKKNATYSTHMYGCPHCPRANASPEITDRLRQFRHDPKAEVLFHAETLMESPHWCSYPHSG